MIFLIKVKKLFCPKSLYRIYINMLYINMVLYVQEVVSYYIK